MNDIRYERGDEAAYLESLHALGTWWRRLNVRISRASPTRMAALRKAWRRSRLGGAVFPWCRREAEIVGKVAGVVTLSLWLKRLIEQFLASKILNESILRGEMSDVVRDVEQEVEAGRARHGQRKQ